MVTDPKPGDRVIVTQYDVKRDPVTGRLLSARAGINPRRGTIVAVDDVGVCGVRLDGSKKVVPRFKGSPTIEVLPLLDQIAEELM